MASPTELFDRIGKILGEVEDIWDYLNTYVSSLATINAQATDADRFQLEALNGNETSDLLSLETLLLNLTAAAQKVLIEELDDQEPLVEKTLLEALKALRIRLDTETETISESTVAIATPIYTKATGTGKVSTSASGVETTTEVIQKTLQNLRAETVVLTCTNDSQGGATDEGRELFRGKGEDPALNTSHLFPLGSGLTLQVVSCHAGVEETVGPGGNYLKNSGFETFTVTDTPDSWERIVGVVSVDFQKSTTALRGSSSLELVGTALSHFRERFTHKNQTDADLTTRLKPQTRYNLTFWLQAGAVAPTAGQIQIGIAGSDVAPIYGSVAVTLTTLTGPGTWDFYEVSFATDAEVHDQPEVFLRMDVAMGAANESVLIDEIVLQEMFQDDLRLGSPFMSIVAGATDWRKDDRVTFAATRSGGKLLKFMDAVYGLHENGITFPSAADAGATYKDALVS